MKPETTIEQDFRGGLITKNGLQNSCLIRLFFSGILHWLYPMAWNTTIPASGKMVIQFGEYWHWAMK